MEFSKSELELLVNQGKGDLGKVLLEHENEEEKIADAIKAICDLTDKKLVAKFIATKLIPSLLSLQNSPVRKTLLNLSCHLTEKYPIDLLSIAEIRDFKSETKRSCLDSITVMRKLHDNAWSEVWILLVNYLKEHIHTDVDFANSLFRLVEAGFKSPSDQIGSYDCWKALIKNYQLNKTFIKRTKHLKLLITPLKCKLSGTEALQNKRFEVWMCLLNALKEDATEVISAFLHFCFSNEKRYPLLWKEATGVLLELIGHRKLCESPNCCNIVGTHSLDFTVVTPKNFNSYYIVVIDSIIQCSLVMEKWADQNTQKQVIGCLWGTLDILHKSLEATAASNAEEKISNFLEVTIFSKYKENSRIASVMVFIMELNITRTAAVLKRILLNKPESYRSIIYISVLETCSHKMDKTKFTKLGSQILADYTIDWESRLFYLIWQLYYDFFDANGYIHISSTDAAIFLISFLIKLDRFSTKEVDISKLFRRFLRKFPHFENFFMTELGRVVQSHETLCKEAVNAVILLVESCGSDIKKYEFSVLQLCWEVLLRTLDMPPTIRNLGKIAAIIPTLLSVNFKRFTEIEQVELLEKIGRTLHLLIEKHKVYFIFDELEPFISSISNPMKVIISHNLKTTLLTLASCKLQFDTAKKAEKLYHALMTKKPVHHSMTLSRGAKLTSLALHDMENTIKLRGSQLNKSLPDVSQNGSEFPTIFGKSEEEKFAVIDSEYRFDKTKLSEHQKEQLKKRRDDIPSLYVDLTQDTQSLSLTEDSSRSEEKQNNSINTESKRTEEKQQLQTNSLNLDETKSNGMETPAVNGWETSKPEDSIQQTNCASSNPEKVVLDGIGSREKDTGDVPDVATPESVERAETPSQVAKPKNTATKFFIPLETDNNTLGKNITQTTTNGDESNQVSVIKRKRGRPLKKDKLKNIFLLSTANSILDGQSLNNFTQTNKEQEKTDLPLIKKRKPGRPRKHEIPNQFHRWSMVRKIFNTDITENKSSQSLVKKRKRGRPRKWKMQETFFLSKRHNHIEEDNDDVKVELEGEANEKMNNTETMHIEATTSTPHLQNPVEFYEVFDMNQDDPEADSEVSRGKKSPTTRELARLKINACFDVVIPNDSPQTKRVTRRLSKIKENNRTVRNVDNNNIEVVESSQNEFVRIEPLFDEQTLGNGRETINKQMPISNKKKRSSHNVVEKETDKNTDNETETKKPVHNGTETTKETKNQTPISDKKNRSSHKDVEKESDKDITSKKQNKQPQTTADESAEKPQIPLVEDNIQKLPEIIESNTKQQDCIIVEKIEHLYNGIDKNQKNEEPVPILKTDDFKEKMSIFETGSPNKPKEDKKEKLFVENGDGQSDNGVEGETENENQITQSDLKKDTETCDPFEVFSVVLEFDTDKPVEPMDVTALCKDSLERDTDSVEIENDLPGSPKTPEKTSELLLVTSDISPISERIQMKPNETSTLKQRTLEDYIQQSSRSKKMLDSLANNKQLSETLISTPIQQEGKAFLVFSRELPSSDARPAGGSILKRKRPDFTDDVSPCVKRKRVNFPDPPITSEKLILNEEADESVKKCKKQLNMNQAEPVIDATENSDNLEIRTIIEKSTDSLIKALSELNASGEGDMTFLLHTFKRIEEAMPRVVLAKVVHEILENRQ